MAKKPATPPRKGRARPVKEVEEPKGEFEVEEPKVVVVRTPLGIESALIGITFVALAAAFVMIHLKATAAFGKSWPF